MIYTEAYFKISPLQPAMEILIAELSEIGFESFVEEEGGLKAYIQEDDFMEESLKGIYVLQNPEFTISYELKTIADVNWNAKWESDYESVIIADRCYIRAPFHPTNPEIEFEILIEPKMSFGTAHHETTAQMIQLLLDEDVKGKSVLDMGCGTAVLAILAKLKQADRIVAIDNDEWAYNNALENVKVNGFPDIKVQQGDAALLKDHVFDLILANINKNILLADMNTYADSLPSHGVILFSGFYEDDLNDIISKALEFNLHYHTHLVKNKWVAAKFIKT